MLCLLFYVHAFRLFKSLILIALMQKHSHTYSIATNRLEALNLHKAYINRQSPSKLNAIIIDLSLPIVNDITGILRVRAPEKTTQIEENN